tara:strand:+ start:180 stop:965 length:786 start_codon:yes stop_codon:yes gene_type:complete
MKDNKNFKDDFLFLLNKIKTQESFAFTRFSDGEQYILDNIELKLDQNLIQIGSQHQSGPYKPVDFKHFDPKKHAYHRNLLVESFLHKQHNYFKGIGCPCCNGHEYKINQLNVLGGDSDDLTWANLWVNGNYPDFIKKVLPELYNNKCVMICHKDANLDKLPFIKKDFRVGYNAMVNNLDVIEKIKIWIKENKIINHIFLFSASSFSNIAIYELFKTNTNNTFIDIGTCLTPMMNTPTERDYLQGYWTYKGSKSLNLICKWN